MFWFVLFVCLSCSFFSVCFPTKWKGNKENEICSVTLLAEKELFFLRSVLSWVLFGCWEIQEKVRNKTNGIFIFIFIFFLFGSKENYEGKRKEMKELNFFPCFDPFSTIWIWLSRMINLGNLLIVFIHVLVCLQNSKSYKREAMIPYLAMTYFDMFISRNELPVLILLNFIIVVFVVAINSFHRSLFINLLTLSTFLIIRMF